MKSATAPRWSCGRPVDFGIARMYGVRAQKVDPDFAVFRDLGEAEAWRQGAR